MSVTPRGMSIQEAYREYRDGNFIVNRRYQRKLVWTLEEKRRLVDSIVQGYPIPLFLFATRLESSGRKRYEILDGMQRLHTIFSYIENHFSYGSKYFDVIQLSRANQLSEAGVIDTVKEEKKLLSAKICANILDYTLAITEFPFQSSDAVNEVFRRINSYGKQLSGHEKRQAGVISSFATTIRELAAEIRGDVSAEKLNLTDMPSISINVERQEYGINADYSFWCKQGILRKNQLRDGDDEQMLADLSISIIEGKPFAFSGDKLDRYYDIKSDESTTLNEKLLTIGPEALKHDIITVISIIRKTFDLDSERNDLRSVLHPKAGSNPIKTAFYALFLAFYDLCITEEKTPEQHEKIVNGLKSLHDKLNVAAGSITSDKRQQNINIVKGVIGSYFIERQPPASQTSYALAIRFENSLRRSKIETSNFECKQGVINIQDDRIENKKLYGKIIKTICAIANIGPQSEGAIFIGVADNENDKDLIERNDNIESIKIGNRYVVGIDRELSMLDRTLEEYKRKFVSEISHSNLSEPLKTSVLSTVELIDYRRLSVICIWIASQKEVSTVNDIIYKREGSSTIKVEGMSKTKALLSIFQTNQIES